MSTKWPKMANVYPIYWVQMGPTLLLHFWGSAYDLGDLRSKPLGESLFSLGIRASPVAQRVKHLPVMRKSQVWSLGWEDPLEKEMAPHSSIFEKSHGQRSLVAYSPWGCKESDMTEWLHLHTYFYSWFNCMVQHGHRILLEPTRYKETFTWASLKTHSLAHSHMHWNRKDLRPWLALSKMVATSHMEWLSVTCAFHVQLVPWNGTSTERDMM